MVSGSAAQSDTTGSITVPIPGTSISLPIPIHKSSSTPDSNTLIGAASPALGTHDHDPRTLLGPFSFTVISIAKSSAEKDGRRVSGLAIAYMLPTDVTTDAISWTPLSYE